MIAPVIGAATAAVGMWGAALLVAAGATSPPPVTPPAVPVSPSTPRAESPAPPLPPASTASPAAAAGTGKKPESRKAAPTAASARATAPEPADRLPTAIPPSLTAAALRQEMDTARRPEREMPGGERARLEQLAAEIARAREALREETVRLQALLGRGGGAPPSDGSALPIGDPLASASVSAPTGPPREIAKDQVDGLAKAMKEMKPEQAAAIIARLERRLAVEVLRRMRAADTGAVLAQLKPELAAELATELATRGAGDGGAKKERH